MKKEQMFTIQDVGRVKMAGGSVLPYYEAAQPTIARGPAGALETTENFKQLREQVPFSILLAYFPDDPQTIKNRLRGSGLYRHLRADQGMGGNFTGHQVRKDAELKYQLSKEQGFALLEYPVQKQLELAEFAALSPLVDEIIKKFSKNNYRETDQLVASFLNLAERAQLCLPNGELVGSKTGFFFIRPTETLPEAAFPEHLLPTVQEKLAQALLVPQSLAEYTRQALQEGHDYQTAIELAEKNYQEHGPTDYTGSGILYCQPDCITLNDGQIEIERVQIPDVGLFLSQLSAPNNKPMSKVIEINQHLKDRVGAVLEKYYTQPHVTIVTRDEVVTHQSDSLELIEIQALTKLLEAMGKTVTVLPLSATTTVSTQTQLLLLNVDPSEKAYHRLATKVVTEAITCYPDPLLKAFQEKATTLPTFELTGHHLEKFLELVKPKHVKEKNAARLQAELEKYLEIAGLHQDILYVSFDGLNTPLPVFRYSLHSFFQIYNAVQKVEQTGKPVSNITFSGLPFVPEKAVFAGKDGPRLAAFRFMATREDN